MKKVFVLISFIVTINSAYSQIANNWVFGYKCGFNFSTGTIQTFESKISEKYCANYFNFDTVASLFGNSISDCNGKLLFYTNGKCVWNSTNHLMPNYCINDTVNDNLYENFKILKFPNNDSLYYIFYSTVGFGLRYAVVNINADSGRGNVISAHNFIVNSGLPMFPAVLIRHSNDSNYWLVCKPNANQIYSYLITSSGISLTPVISNAGGYYSHLSELKASMSGRFLFYNDFINPGANFNNGYCCDFNRNTGLITNIKTIFKYSNFPNPTLHLFAVEFSPNDSFIYTTTWVAPGGNARITQFKRYLNNPGNFPYELAFINTSSIIGIQLAPDGKIYLGNWQHGIISCITRPDEFEGGCNFVYNYLDVSPLTLGGGFPSVYFPLHRLKFNATSFSLSSCLTDSVRLFAQGDTTFLNYRWYIYDTNLVLLDSADGKNIVKWLAPGAYKIKLRAKNTICDSYTWWTDDIFVSYKPKVVAVIDSTKISCARQTVFLHYTSQFSDSVSVNWGDGTVSNWIKADSVGYFTHHYLDSSHVYSIQLFAKNSVCNASASLTDTVVLQPKPLAKCFANNASQSFPLAGCAPLFVNVFDSSKYADSVWYVARRNGLNYQLSILNYQLTDSGWYDLVQYVSSKDGCLDSFVVNRGIYVSPVAALQVGMDSAYNKCINNHLRLKLISSYCTSVKIVWGDGDSSLIAGNINGVKTDTITHFYNLSGSFILSVSGNNAFCSSIKTIMHFVRLPVRVVTTPDTTICYGATVNLSITANGADSVFSYVLKTPTTLLMSSVGSFFVAPVATTVYFLGAVNNCTADTTWKLLVVTVKPRLQVASSLLDTMVCKGTVLNLLATAKGGNDSAAYQFTLLKNGVALAQNHSGLFSISATASFDYALVVSDGCSRNDTTAFKVSIFNPVKLLLNTRDSVLCKPGNVGVRAVASGGDSLHYVYRLFKDGVLMQSNSTGIFNLFHDSTHTYSAVVTDGCGQIDSILFKYSIRAPLHLSLNHADTALCKGVVFNVKATAVNGTGNFVFTLLNASMQIISNSSTGNFIIPTDSSSNYLFTLADNCSASIDSLWLHVRIIGSGARDTVGILYTTVLSESSTFTIWNKGQDKLSYSINNQTVTDTFFTDHAAHPSLGSEKYFVTATDVCGNKSVVSKVAQTIYLQAENDASGNYAILSYTPYETWKQGVLQYDIESFSTLQNKWIKVATVPGNTLNTKAAVLSDSTSFNASTARQCYRIIAQEQNGNQQQSTSNEACVSVFPIAFIPTAFSPNGDGINDFYKPVCAGMSYYNFEIYDRWGQLVYTDTPESKGWDGTFEGKPLPIGIYVYKLTGQSPQHNQFTNTGGAINRAATIMLVR